MNIWSNKYEIGQESLDNHHRELFDLVTMLDEAIVSNNPKNIEKIIQFLEHYSIHHFAEEEALMTKKHYKGLQHHQHEHQKLSLLISHLRSIYDSHHPPSHIIFEIRKLIDTLVNHIQTVDIGIVDLVNKGHS
jgi:hemerythrin